MWLLVYSCIGAVSFLWKNGITENHTCKAVEGDYTWVSFKVKISALVHFN